MKTIIIYKVEESVYAKGPNFSALNQAIIGELSFNQFVAAMTPHLSGTPGIEALELNDQTVNFFSRRGPAAPQDFELRKVRVESVFCIRTD